MINLQLSRNFNIINALCVRIGSDFMFNVNGGETQNINVGKELELDVPKILEEVYNALAEKGYNPVNQIVGYIMSGDPTYITSYKGARSLIMKAERDEIIEVLMDNYIETNFKDK